MGHQVFCQVSVPGCHVVIRLVGFPVCSKFAFLVCCPEFFPICNLEGCNVGLVVGHLSGRPVVRNVCRAVDWQVRHPVGLTVGQNLVRQVSRQVNLSGLSCSRSFSRFSST